MAGAGLDWAHEWIASLAWIGEAFAVTLVGFALLSWLLARYTTWGRRFRRLSYAYFRPSAGNRASWRPLLTVLVLLLVTVISVRIVVLVSYASNGLYTAPQALSASGFAHYLGIFGVLAAIYSSPTSDSARHTVGVEGAGPITGAQVPQLLEVADRLRTRICATARSIRIWPRS